MKRLSCIGCRIQGTRSTICRTTAATFTTKSKSNTHTSSSPSSSPAVPPLSPYSYPRFVSGQLTRDFISASLYSQTQGYFNTRTRIHSADTETALPFHSLKHRDDYQFKLKDLYAQLDESWLTPVELFKPYYAQAIARWIIHTRRHTQQQTTENANSPLHIVEVGGGNGTCALGILDYLQRMHPSVYQHTHYTIVDLSQTNRQQQAQTLHKHLDTSSTTSAARVRLRHMNILDWNEYMDENVFVIALEVLDNMPHDKIVYQQTGPSSQYVYQTHVHALDEPTADQVVVRQTDPTQQYREQLAPVNDPWIMEWLNYHDEYERVASSSSSGFSPTSLWHYHYGSIGNAIAMTYSSVVQYLTQLILSLSSSASQTIRYVPTTALHFFHLLHHFIPNHHLLIADFSTLPDTLAGINAPIVSSRTNPSHNTEGEKRDTTTADNTTTSIARTTTSSSTTTSSNPTDSSAVKKRSLPIVKDYRHYLLPLGTADIFFPINFEELEFMYERVKQVRHQRDALRRRPTSIATTTPSPTPPSSPLPPRVFSNYEFMRLYAIEAAQKEWEEQRQQQSSSSSSSKWRSPTRTKAHYDPLLQDYANFKFFVT